MTFGVLNIPRGGVSALGLLLKFSVLPIFLLNSLAFTIYKIFQSEHVFAWNEILMWPEVNFYCCFPSSSLLLPPSIDTTKGIHFSN